MPSIREILEKNNITLDISEAALDLEFEGNFIFSGTTQESKGDVLNHPNEFNVGFFFYNGKDKLRIVPDDPDYVVRYTQIFDDGDFYFEAYASDGRLSIIT